MLKLSTRFKISPSYLILLLIGLYVILYSQTIHKLIILWVEGSEAYSHGILLLVISIYFFVKKWLHVRNTLTCTINIFALLALIALSFVWLSARMIYINTIELLTLPFILAAILITAIGWRKAREFMFPVLLLLMALPLFDWIIPLLQKITAVMVGILLGLIDVTAMVEGVLIFVPAGTFEVDGGCSGLNVFLVGIVLSLLYAYISGFNLKESILLLFITIIFSISANIIRVFMIVVAGNLTNMQHPWIEDHVNLGWIVFLVMMGMLFFVVERFWSRLPAYVRSGRVSDETSASTLASGSCHKCFIFAALAMSCAPIFVMVHAGQPLKHTQDSLKAYSKLGQWEKIDQLPGQVWGIKFDGGSGTAGYDQAYVNPDQKRVDLNVRYFANQQPGNEAINQTNSVYNRKNWTRVWVRLKDVGESRQMRGSIEEVLVKDHKNNEILIWRWYSVLGRNTGNHYMAKLYNLAAVLSGKPDVTVYVISARIASSRKETRLILTEFRNLILKEHM